MMAAKQACRAYVGNLAWKVNWYDLKDHMRQHGCNVVHADVFMDGQGNSRGCGIVEFASPEEAREAMEKTNNTELCGRNIFVREDKEEGTDRRQQGGGGYRNRGGFRGGFRGGRGGGGGGFRGGNNGEYRDNNNGNNNNNRPMNPDREVVTLEPNECQVFVGNLPWKTREDELLTLFKEVGDVEKVEVYERDGRSRGCGTVLFATPELAKKAVELMNERRVDGRDILVRIDQGRKVAVPRGAGGAAAGNNNGGEDGGNDGAPAAAGNNDGGNLSDESPVPEQGTGEVSNDNKQG